MYINLYPLPKKSGGFLISLFLMCLKVLEAFATALADGPALKRGTQLLFTLQQACIHCCNPWKEAVKVSTTGLIDELIFCHNQCSLSRIPTCGASFVFGVRATSTCRWANMCLVLARPHQKLSSEKMASMDSMVIVVPLIIHISTDPNEKYYLGRCSFYKLVDGIYCMDIGMYEI